MVFIMRSNERENKMNKILIVILILLFIFAFIRITTSTYENLNREQNLKVLPVTSVEFY